MQNKQQLFPRPFQHVSKFESHVKLSSIYLFLTLICECYNYLFSLRVLIPFPVPIIYASIYGHKAWRIHVQMHLSLYQVVQLNHACYIDYHLISEVKYTIDWLDNKYIKFHLCRSLINSIIQLKKKHVTSAWRRAVYKADDDDDICKACRLFTCCVRIARKTKTPWHLCFKHLLYCNHLVWSCTALSQIHL